MNVTNMGQTEPGYLFFTPENIIHVVTATHLYTVCDDGQLVWQGPNASYSALQHQILDGEPFIALWTGHAAQDYGFGTISFLNSSYDEIYRVILGCKEQKLVTVFEPMEFDSCIDIH